MACKLQVALLWLMVALLAIGVSASSLSKVASHPFTVHGKVYCDTCRCGFETNITTYIPKAVVRIECIPREQGRKHKVMYSAEGVTDHTGSYSIQVNYDHGDHICEAVLVSSPWKRCSKPDKGRDRSRVILTDLNGVASHYRYSNNLGFLADRAHPSCPRLLDYYLRTDDDH